MNVLNASLPRLVAMTGDNGPTRSLLHSSRTVGEVTYAMSLILS